MIKASEKLVSKYGKEQEKKKERRMSRENLVHLSHMPPMAATPANEKPFYLHTHTEDFYSYSSVHAPAPAEDIFVHCESLDRKV